MFITALRPSHIKPRVVIGRHHSEPHFLRRRVILGQIACTPHRSLGAYQATRTLENLMDQYCIRNLSMVLSMKACFLCYVLDETLPLLSKIREIWVLGNCAYLKVLVRIITARLDLHITSMYRNMLRTRVRVCLLETST